MSALDVFAASACFGLIGSLFWALVTGNLAPLGIALGYTAACWGATEIAQWRDRHAPYSDNTRRALRLWLRANRRRSA